MITRANTTGLAPATSAAWATERALTALRQGKGEDARGWLTLSASLSQRAAEELLRAAWGVSR